MKKCRAYQNAEQDIMDLTLIVDNHWYHIEDQITCLQGIWQTFPGYLQVHYNLVFQRLNSKLQESIKLIDSVSVRSDGELSITGQSRKRWDYKKSKFVWSSKESIERAIKELDDWRHMLDSSWYMIKLINNRLIDDELAKHHASVKSPVSVLRSMRDDERNGIHSAGTGEGVLINSDFVTGRTSLRHSPAKLAEEKLTGLAVIVDTMVCRPEADASMVTKDVRDLARRLTKSDPDSFNLLGCRGVLKHDSKDCDDQRTANRQPLTFEFVFAIPRIFSKPKSLRDVLLSQRKPPFLELKIELAKQLANSVAFVHNANFVHKNIRPEAILTFEKEGRPLEASCLVGFDAFRMAEGRTYGHGDCSWERNLYRHPLQQGLLPHRYYTMQHDIYSLGVCLLEIGLWESFVTFDEDSGEARPGHDATIAGALAVPDEVERPLGIQKALIIAAQERLPFSVGSKYSDVVVSCLTCLDEEPEFRDDDGVIIGVKYIERVLFELRDIVV